MTRRVWDRYYEIGIKNLVDAIHNSADKANLNAALRIHRVYLTAVLADTYGDVPCSEAGLGYISGISAPKYDTVEELYSWFFEELDSCEKQLGTGTDRISGDVTSMRGDVAQWKKYANSEAISELLAREPEYTDSVVANVKRFIEKYSELYESAPSGSPKACEWTFKKESYGFYSAETLAGQDLSEENDVIYAVAKVGEVESFVFPVMPLSHPFSGPWRIRPQWNLP